MGNGAGIKEYSFCGFLPSDIAYAVQQMRNLSIALGRERTHAKQAYFILKKLSLLYSKHRKLSFILLLNFPPFLSAVFSPYRLTHSLLPKSARRLLRKSRPPASSPLPAYSLFRKSPMLPEGSFQPSRLQCRNAINCERWHWDNAFPPLIQIK